MRILTRTAVIALALAFTLGLASCGKKADHWGQYFDESGSWWKQEGQSWDRDNNIFMTIGYSNPDWKDKYDARKSADLNARAQVAEFMASLVKSYMQEIRSKNFAMSESELKSIADETVVGAVIVDRKFKKKQYMSLIKVDVGYFFSTVYKKYRADAEAKVRRANPKASGTELDELIRSKVDAALVELEKAKEPSVEKAMEQDAVKSETKSEKTE